MKGINPIANHGTFFKLSPNPDHSRWTFAKLYDFGYSYGVCGCYGPTDISYAGEGTGALYDGFSPLFGTTLGGGGKNKSGVSDPGTVFRLLRSQDGTWSARAIHSFCSLADCADGMLPRTIVVASPTKLFGTTSTYGTGLLFELHYSNGHWHEKAIYSFCGPDCTGISIPSGRFLLSPKGNLFGASSRRGAYDNGAVFKIIPRLVGAKATILYSFCRSSRNCLDGQYPMGGLAFDSSGALLGTTVDGGHEGVGTIFRLQGSSLKTLYSFCPNWPTCDGQFPEHGVTVDSSGDMFGTTLYGGAFNNGVVFRLSVPIAPSRG